MAYLYDINVNPRVVLDFNFPRMENIMRTNKELTTRTTT